MLRHTLRFARKYSASPKTSSLNLGLIGGILCLGPAYAFLRSRVQSPTPLETTSDKQDEHHLKSMVTAGMPYVEYVIVGGGTASFSAMEAIKSAKPNANILIVSEQEYLPYERPPLSKELWFSKESDQLTFTDWQGHSKSLFYKPKVDGIDKGLKAQGKVHFMKNARVDSINTQDKTISVGKKVVGFSKLLIATGGEPKSLPIVNGLDSDVRSKISTFRGVNDFKRLSKLAQDGSKMIAVVGGGFLGSELATALAQKKAKVVQVFPEKGNMSMILPAYLSKWTTSRVKNEGVDVKPDSQIAGFTKEDSKIAVQIKDQEPIIADHVVLAVGLMPSVGLAERSGLEIDPVLGGIVVNAELEARSDIYAAGDVTSYHDVALGRRRVEHYDHAVESGRLAGLNMTGAKKPYMHQSMFWSNLGPSVSYEAVGIVGSSLPTVSIWAKPADKPATPGEEDLGKGVVYYLNKEKHVVGVLLWNLHGKLDDARKLIASKRPYAAKDLSGIIKIYE